jgi:YVTN family beta-propeller protein
VVNFSDDDVSVIDTLALKAVATVGVGNSPNAVGMFIAPAPPASALVAAILPGGRSLQLGNPATVFATVLNAGSADLDNCQIALPGPDGLTLDYQTTNPATNALTGQPDTPVSIPGNGYQTFVLTFQASAALAVEGLPLVFGCDGTPPAPVTIGVDTIDLIFSPVPIADIIALAATVSGNGVVTVPYSQGGAGAFALASVNSGAAGNLTVVTDTGDASLPITVTLCQTDPSNGQCLAPPAASVPVSIAANATPTFSIFVTASDTVGFAPGTARIFVRFVDGGGTSHGSTSVAVMTD